MELLASFYLPIYNTRVKQTLSVEMDVPTYMKYFIISKLRSNCPSA